MAKSTQRINLGKPYEDYINTLVESGYYASATEVIRDALRLKMNNKDEHRKAVIYKMVEQAQESIREGNFIEDSPALRKQMLNEAKANSKKGKPIPNYITGS
jgi:antitoxin ParD1/3/4